MIDSGPSPPFKRRRRLNSRPMATDQILYLEHPTIGRGSLQLTTDVLATFDIDAILAALNESALATIRRPQTLGLDLVQTLTTIDAFVRRQSQSSWTMFWHLHHNNDPLHVIVPLPDDAALARAAVETSLKAFEGAMTFVRESSRSDEQMREILRVFTEDIGGHLDAFNAPLRAYGEAYLAADRAAAAAGELAGSGLNDHQSALLRELKNDLRVLSQIAVTADKTTPLHGSATHADTPEVAAALSLRDRLLTKEPWYSARKVAEVERGGIVESNPRQYASRLRLERQILGVLFRGQYLHPAWQWRAGRRLARLKELIERLPVIDEGWEAVAWTFQPTGRLNGRRPADVFADDPQSVIDAAEKDFHGDDG